METDYNVAPGSTSGSQRFYAAFFNETPGGAFSVLSIDPNSGDTKVIKSPLAGEYGAWGMTVGPDGNIYLGTTPSAHFMRLNTASGTLTDLGRPSSTETYIWGATFGSDGRLYGVTYPNCKLVRYDPATGRLADLGRLDAVQKYARNIIATSDGYLYASIGSDASNIAAYQISTGTVRELLPASAQQTTFPSLHVGIDGKPYGQVSSTNYALGPSAAIQITAGQVSPGTPHNKLADGRYVTLSTSIGSAGSYVLSMTVTNPKLGTSTTTPLSYPGELINVFRLGVGPGNTVYGSTILPADLFAVDSSANDIRHIGSVGTGEVYSFLPYGNSLAMASYYGLAPLMSYNPSAAFGGSGSSQNPKLQTYTGSDMGWRPQAIAQGADGQIYMGSSAGLGSYNGPLVEWDPAAGTAKIDTQVTNQIVASLVPWQNEIIAGTSTIKGSTSTIAKLFGWNTISHQIDWSVVPVAGAGVITDLVSSSNGLIYGIADNTFFEFNPATQTVTRRATLNFALDTGNMYNSASIDDAGRIWGLAPTGVFVIDTSTLYNYLIAPSPVTITRGWALANGDAYFASGAAVYSYTLPTKAGSITITPAQTSFMANAPLNVSVSVTGTSPTGTIILKAGTFTSLPVTLTNGGCTFTVPASSFSPGAGAISAFYSGDVQNLYSTASIQVTASLSTPKVSVGLSASSLLVNQSLTVSAAVVGNSATPTGTATVTAGSYTSQAVALSSGKVSFTVPAGSFAPGTDVVSVSYSGDATYSGGSGTASLSVSKATPTVKVALSASTVAVGSPFTATVTVSGSTGTPGGTATVTAGGYTSPATTIVNGTATVTIPAGSLSLGSNAVSVSYSGDANYLSGSASTSLMEVKATSKVTLTPAAVMSPISSSQTFYVSVSGNAGTPTGTIILWEPGYNFGSVALSSGAATFVIPAGKLAVGAITLTASYGGDSNYTTGAATATITETQATASITVKPSASTTSISKPLAVSVTVLGNSGTPSGTVTLAAGSYSATATLSGGWAGFTAPAGSLPAGVDTLTVRYNGNASYFAGSGTAQVTVTNP